MPDNDRVNGYRSQHGCHNCHRVFILSEHDCGLSYYCTSGAPDRPMCLSVAMSEVPVPYNVETHEAAMDAWEEWSDGREVDPWGICDHWMRAIPKDRDFSEGAVQCNWCGGLGCEHCEDRGWYADSDHPNGRRCEYCRIPLKPDHIAVYCSHECALADA